MVGKSSRDDDKMIVQTTGPFMLVDMTSGQEVPSHRPALVSPTPFIQQRIATKQLEVLENDVDSEKTDAEFAKDWADGKYKVKKAKQPVKPLEAGSALGKKEDEQRDGESDEAFEKRMDELEVTKKAQANGGVRENIFVKP